MNTKSVVEGRWWVMVSVMAFFLASFTLYVGAQKDRGRNQSGAVGNNPGGDPGRNQPGAVGNNPGRDPGVNQPGAAGNRGVGGSARQTRVVGDPGRNQPGRIG